MAQANISRDALVEAWKVCHVNCFIESSSGTLFSLKTFCRFGRDPNNFLKIVENEEDMTVSFQVSRDFVEKMHPSFAEV